jgi:hypothetical protein
MSILLLDRFLFKPAIAWVPVSGIDINDPPSAVFLGTQTPTNSMLVHNGLDVPWGGALLSLTRPLPVLDGELLRYSAWRFRFRFIPETYDNLARFENDKKTCIKSRPNAETKIRNVCNYSTQLNFDTGEIEIDHDPPAWLGSGFFPRHTEPDIWHALDYRFSFDPEPLTFSIDSIQWDDELYVMPEEHRNIPMSETNWEECDKYQIQNEGYEPGTVLIEFDDGLGVYSNEPIPAEIPSQESY